MAKVLRGGAYGPGGMDDYVPAGEPPNPDWPQWFLDDLADHDHLVDAPQDGQRPSGDSEPVAVTGRSSRGRKAKQ